MSFVLRVTGVSRATWYMHRRKETSQRDYDMTHLRGRPAPGYTVNRDGTVIMDSTLVSVLRGYRQRPEYANGGGVDKLRHYLMRDHGFYVNRKKIYRICRENGLLLEKRGVKGRHKGSFVNRNHVVRRPNQLWEFDIKYGYIHGERRFFFVLAFVDVYSRKCVGRYVGLSCRKWDLCVTLRESLFRESVTPENELIIRSDNGPQMRSNQFHQYLEKLEQELSHEFIPIQTPNKDAHVESFFSILEMEFFRVRYFHSFADAYEQTHAFIDFYNETRIHGSIGMKSPAEIVTLWKNNQKVNVQPVRL